MPSIRRGQNGHMALRMAVRRVILAVESVVSNLFEATILRPAAFVRQMAYRRLVFDEYLAIVKCIVTMTTIGALLGARRRRAVYLPAVIFQCMLVTLIFGDNGLPSRIAASPSAKIGVAYLICA